MWSKLLTIELLILYFDYGIKYFSLFLFCPPKIFYFFAYKPLNIIFWNARAIALGLRKEKKQQLFQSLFHFRKESL